MFASSSAGATRTLTHPGGPAENRTAPSRWRTRYATSPCPIYTRARVVGRHCRRARPPNCPRSSLVIIKLRTIARTAKLVQIIRITVLSVTPSVIVGKASAREAGLALIFIALNLLHVARQRSANVLRRFSRDTRSGVGGGGARWK